MIFYMHHPIFSCVIPVKGERLFFKGALASLEAQGMGDDLEIIVQDGDVGSGGVEELGVGELHNLQWHREADAGQSDALNKGFAKAKGEWLFWLNADDVVLQNSLKRVKDAATEPVNWISGNVIYMDKDGKAKWCAWDRGSKLAYQKLPVQVYGPSSFFRKSLFEEAGGFDVSLNYSMDIDLWCKFRQLGYWYTKLPNFVWGFRLHEGSKTSSAQQGQWLQEHVAELNLINKRYGLSNCCFTRCFARCVRIVNGSYLKAWCDTRRIKGHQVISG